MTNDNEFKKSFDATEFVKKRRDRVLATILSYKEANVDKYLSEQERQMLRRVIISNVNDFNDLVLDIIKADIPVVEEWNSLYFEALNRIEEKIQKMIEDDYST